MDGALDLLAKEPGFEDVIRIRCGAHVLNLVVKAGLGELTLPVGKIRHLVSKVHNSREIYRNFQEHHSANDKKTKVRRIRLDVPTRWNSTYIMLKDAFQFRVALHLLATNDPSLSDYALTDFEWSEVKAFINFLEPFYKNTLELQRPQNAFICSVLPVLHELKPAIQKYQECGKHS